MKELVTFIRNRIIIQIRKRGAAVSFETEQQMAEFIQTCKEFVKIDHDYAQAQGLSDTSFYILYALARHGSAYSQRTLCSDWSLPPQTVNSALKKMERQGFIELHLRSGSRKNKEICLTPGGRELMKQAVEPFMEAEQNSFSKISPENRGIMLSALHQYLALLKEEMGRSRRQDTEKK